LTEKSLEKCGNGAKKRHFSRYLEHFSQFLLIFWQKLAIFLHF